VPRVTTLPLADAEPAARGYTPNELAKVLRVSPDRIRQWIKGGELGAIDTSRRRCGRPRFVVLPHHLAEFERRRACGPTPKPQRRRRTFVIDYFPD
jgi:excisionase family DNA binding protein